MAAPTYDFIIKEIRKGRLSPVYLLTGEESYFIDRVLDVLQNEVIEEAERDFNLHVLYGLETEMEKAVGLCKGFPMMGNRQMIIIREAQEMREWKDRSEDKTKLNSITNYVQNPQPSTILVLVYRHKKIDNRLPLVKLIKEKGIYFESAKLRDYQIPEWINKTAKEKGLTLEPEATMMLSDFVGAHPANIIMELEKLSIAKPDQTITKKDISEFIGVSKEYNLFEFQKALGKRDVLLCNKIINHFAANPKENPLPMILPGLVGYFTKIGQYQEMAKQNLPDAQIASTMSVNPYFLKEYKEAANTFSSNKLMRIFGYLRETDRMSKGLGNRGLPHDALMKEMVYKILH